MAIKSAALVAKLDHLYPLPQSDLDTLLGAFSATIDFREDRDIVTEGDRPTQCSLLLEGFVQRYKILADGRRQILSFHFPGDIFDTQSFLLDVMDHSVAALTPARIAIVTHATLREITECHPRIARALWKETLADAAMFRQWLTSAGRRTAYQRISHLVCEVYVRQLAINMAGRLSMQWPITQVEIADALGLSHVHINRTLQEMRRDGLIRLRGTSLDILDWSALRNAGEFDPTYLQLGQLPVP